ncbi:MAG TPA: MauE/DoxX family redox-associated membrane protein [Thermoanaerobaculia bacterium]
MSSFVVLCSLALVCALLAVTGGGHLFGLAAFARLLRQHAVVPPALAAPAALAVTAAELAIAAAAARALAGGDPRLRLVAFAGAVACGGAFLAYLRRLMRSGHTGSCGCSPLASSLTPASFAPAGALAAAGTLGLAASPLAASASPAAIAVLPAAWGATLAGLVLLLPASAPAAAEAAT